MHAKDLGLPGLAADVLDQLVGRVLRNFRSIFHFDLLIDKMNQKSFVVQIPKSVPWVLTSDMIVEVDPLPDACLRL